MESVMQHSTFARKLKRRHRHLSIWLEYTRESKTSTRSEEFERRRSPIQPNNTDFAEQETPKPAWTYGTNSTRMSSNAEAAINRRLGLATSTRQVVTHGQPTGGV